MRRKLVLYFSVYGTTRTFAKTIARQANADISEIQPAKPYDSNRDSYNVLARRAKKEHDKDMRPAIKNKIPIGEYTDIFIGYPVWWYTFPMILYTLFEQYDFSGKTIIPFNTHLGSRDSGTYEMMKQLAPHAEILKGLSIEMQDTEDGLELAVQKWLTELGYFEEVTNHV